MNAKQLLEVMADLEARIAKIYDRFATEFREVSDVGDLWVSMGREELHHAEHLSLAAGSAPPVLVPTAVEKHVTHLESAVGQRERELARTVQLQEALQATADLEEAEAEHLHGALTMLGEWAGKLAQDPVMQHRQRGLLEHAIELFGTPEVRARVAWRRFQD